jgi:hypothetical protein
MDDIDQYRVKNSPSRKSRPAYNTGQWLAWADWKELVVEGILVSVSRSLLLLPTFLTPIAWLSRFQLFLTRRRRIVLKSTPPSVTDMDGEISARFGIWLQFFINYCSLLDFAIAFLVIRGITIGQFAARSVCINWNDLCSECWYTWLPQSLGSCG